jgi:hypothetical protein
MRTELERLSQEWNTAWLKKDAAFVEGTMAPEYIYVGPKGQILDREKILSIIRSPTYKLQRATQTEVRVIELAPNAAAMIRRSRSAGSFQGKSFVEDHRCVSVFVKRGRKWMVAFEQCSPIA